jgi:hypothetical protein
MHEGNPAVKLGLYKSSSVTGISIGEGPNQEFESSNNRTLTTRGLEKSLPEDSEGEVKDLNNQK